MHQQNLGVFISHVLHYTIWEHSVPPILFYCRLLLSCQVFVCMPVQTDLILQQIYNEIRASTSNK